MKTVFLAMRHAHHESAVRRRRTVGRSRIKLELIAGEIGHPVSDDALEVRGLRVILPNGEPLIEELSLSVRPGEVAVILGGSGAGKSTFSRVLFEPESLRGDGFSFSATTVKVAPQELGLVPQHGALFDHLDVRGNLELAIRYGCGPAAPEGEEQDPVTAWLERVGLDRALAAPRVAVGSLSGGQAQRVAVARVLAGGRRVLVLDEPSAGLDPHRVRMLACVIREQCDRLKVAMIVVTHDLALAGGSGDSLYVLDPVTKKLERLFEGDWPGPLEREGTDESQRGVWLLRLEREIIARIAAGENGPPPSDHPGRGPAPRRRARALARLVLRPFAVAADALRFLPLQAVRRPGDLLQVAGRVLRQTLLRPLLFYAIVSVLVGYTLLYVMSKVGGAGVRPDALLRQIGGSYVVALAPALSAILFVAASGSAANAWLGTMQLTRQTTALEALGVDPRPYLVAPTWLSLGVASMATAALFAAGMLVGGLIVCLQYDVPGAWRLLTADLIDPRPERVKYVVRAAFLVWMYAWGIASDVVAKGTARKHETEDITRGMTGSVVASTLWVVALELGTVILVFAR